MVYWLPSTLRTFADGRRFSRRSVTLRYGAILAMNGINTSSEVLSCADCFDGRCFCSCVRARSLGSQRAAAGVWCALRRALFWRHRTRYIGVHNRRRLFLALGAFVLIFTILIRGRFNSEKAAGTARAKQLLAEGNLPVPALPNPPKSISGEDLLALKAMRANS